MSSMRGQKKGALAYSTLVMAEALTALLLIAGPAPTDIAATGGPPCLPSYSKTLPLSTEMKKGLSIGEAPLQRPTLPEEPLPSRGERSAAVVQGFASYYGGSDGLDGLPTASGELFDAGALTGAHRTLAFGTRVRVTYLKTGKSVIVRINDRGPFVAGRIIDLSRAAAEAIGLTAHGVGLVQLEVLK